MSTLIRPKVTKRNPYYIPKERYYELKHFCLQYPEWKGELSDVRYYGGKLVEVRGYTEWSDPTCQAAIYHERCKRNIDLVERILKNTDEQLYLYLLKSVTEGRTYENMLTAYGIPCCRDTFYNRYRKFFWLLDHDRE